MEIIGAETNAAHHAVVFYFLKLEETMKECILREDFSGAQEVKIEINLLQHKMLRWELDEIMIRLYKICYYPPPVIKNHSHLRLDWRWFLSYPRPSTSIGMCCPIICHLSLFSTFHSQLSL